ncbi:MAG: hypothetical protein V2B18_11815 [Pseudomonadota bacterium]
MYDGEVLLEKLRTLLEALERIPRLFAGIAAPADLSLLPERSRRAAWGRTLARESYLKDRPVNISG